MPGNHEISKLDDSFDVQTFFCGENGLDDFLKKKALIEQSIGLNRTWVCHPPGSVLVEGYFTLSPYTVSKGNFPLDMVRDFPGYPVPGSVLGKMAVRNELQRSGLSKLLMRSVFETVVEQSKAVGYFALYVDALNDGLVPYYKKFGFIRFEKFPRKLFLPLATIQNALKRLDNPGDRVPTPAAN